MAGWDTTQELRQTDIEDKFKPSLVSRAKKRHGTQVGDRKWIVDGYKKLGDTYEHYYVTLPEGEYKYRCSCQGHVGGEFRKICSHILYVQLARKERVEMDVDIEDSRPFNFDSPPTVETDNTPGNPFQDLPVYVEGSGSSPEEARAELDRYFTSPAEPRPLPDWVQYVRPTQQYAIEQIERLYAEGKKVVFLDAPTGTGKTLLGEMVRRRIAPGRSVYTCSTLTLQDQFEEDFPYADVVKGRSNYPTADSPISFPTLNAAMCNKQVVMDDEVVMCTDCKPAAFAEEGSQNTHCNFCHPTDACSYEQARDRALRSRLAVLNISYLLTVNNYLPRKFSFTESDFVIVDEADVLEEQLLNFITLNITKRQMQNMGMNPPEKKTVPEAWVAWAREEALPNVKTALSRIYAKRGWKTDPKLSKEQSTLKRLERQLLLLGGWDKDKDGWEEDYELDGWVYMDYESGNVTFKPIQVKEFAQDLLWKHSEKWLLMSATIISAQQMADDLGLEDDEWAVVTVDSDFPIENRPIYVQPVANMTWKEKETAWPRMAETIANIVEYHDERILVHTVSYQLAKHIKSRMPAHLRKRVFTYDNARGREAALKRWLKSDNGVMLAPSFERGVDLKDDLCRVVVVAKVPFPNLRDKQINGRLYSKGGQGWYSMLTVRSIVQMTGRAMRSKDDYCEVYMLDQQFVKNILNKNRRILPKWWSDAIVRSGIPKERGIL